MKLPEDRMPEAEVSLRLAFFLIDTGMSSKDISVAIDGAQVETSGQRHFEIEAFLSERGWEQIETTYKWRGTYASANAACRINIHSTSGQGDVVATLNNGDMLRVECKKGPLTRSNSSAEYPLIREAIGQIMTVSSASDTDLFAICVPASDRFSALADKWRNAPLVKKVELMILTVDRENQVSGLESDTITSERRDERCGGSACGSTNPR